VSLQWQLLGVGGKVMSLAVDVYVYAGKKVMKRDLRLFQG